MASTHWLIPAIICLIAWGFSRFFPKLATNHIDARSAFIYEVSGELVIFVAMLAYLGFRPAFEFKGAGFAFLAGITGAIGVFMYLVAAERGNASQLVTVSALYPIITVLLGVFLLNEPLTAKQVVGIIMALFAVVLVAS